MNKVFGLSLTLVIIAMLLLGCGNSTTTKATTSAVSTTSTTTSAAPITSATKTTTTATTSTNPSTTTAAPTTSTAAKTTTTAASSTPATSGNDFSSIVGKASGYTSYSCDVATATTSGGTTTTSTFKYWIKTGNPTKFKMEMTVAGTTTDTIYNGTNYYMYYPSTNTAYVYSVPQTQPSDASSATQYNPVYVGSKTVNTYACAGYQYTSSGVVTTIWISTQYGVAVEIVSGTTTTDYTNYSFSTLPDSTFQLPAGAIMMTIPGM